MGTKNSRRRRENEGRGGKGVSEGDTEGYGVFARGGKGRAERASG